MKIFSFVLLSFVLGVLVTKFYIAPTEEIDPYAYYPHYPKYKKGIFEGILYKVRRGCGNKEISYLKQFGTTIAMYFTDGGSTLYPSNPQVFDFDKSLFFPRHLRGKYICLPENWEIPDNWDEFNQSNCPYVFVRSTKDHYTGSHEVPMFIVRNGYQRYPNVFTAVFEDGHVSKIPRKEAIELWKKAGVWNDLE